MAVLGLGHWYSAYGLARAMPEYPLAELVAAAWPDANQLATFTSTFGIKGYRDYQELLDNEHVDIVHIAAPVVLIPELAIRSARAGKHIVLGKPMAMTVDEADPEFANLLDDPIWPERLASLHRARYTPEDASSAACDVTHLILESDRA